MKISIFHTIVLIPLLFTHELSSSWNCCKKTSASSTQPQSNHPTPAIPKLTPTQWHEYLEATIYDQGCIPNYLPKDKIKRVQYLIELARSQGFLDDQISKIHNSLTPLHKCALQHSYHSRTNQASNDYCQIAELLLQAGADPNAANEGSWGHPPLMFALGHGDTSTSCIALLLAHGANINYINQGGHTPLSFNLRDGLTDSQLAIMKEHGAVATTREEQWSYGKINTHKAAIIKYLKKNNPKFNDNAYQPINLNTNHIQPELLRAIDKETKDKFKITDNDINNYEKVFNIHHGKQH